MTKKRLEEYKVLSKEIDSLRIQISEKVEQTVSNIVNGETKKGFYYEDAVKIHKVLLPEYDRDYLFKREG